MNCTNIITCMCKWHALPLASVFPLHSLLCYCFVQLNEVKAVEVIQQLSLYKNEQHTNLPYSYKAFFQSHKCTHQCRVNSKSCTGTSLSAGKSIYTGSELAAWGPGLYVLVDTCKLTRHG